MSTLGEEVERTHASVATVDIETMDRPGEPTVVVCVLDAAERERLSRTEAALRDLIEAWDVLSDGVYRSSKIEAWLKFSMHPAIARARRALE